MSSPTITRDRYRPIATLYENGIPCMVWAEDAINKFGCRVVADHLFLIVPNPSIAYQCLLASGEYTECPHWFLRYLGVLQEAPRLLRTQEVTRLPIALLQASDWPNFPPLPLSPDPQFPSLDVLLSSLLQMWLQHPYSAFSLCVGVWISSIYDACAHPALTPPAEGDLKAPYFAVARAIPLRIRQLHVDMVYERIFVLDYPAYERYKAIAQAVDLQEASSDNSDLVEVPLPSAEVFGGGWPWCIYYASAVSHKLKIRMLRCPTPFNKHATEE